MNLFVLIASIYAYFLMAKVKKTVSKDSQLTKSEKIQVLITELFSPIIAGAIYYYGWRKKLPTKANQANKYSIIMFFVLIIIMFIIAFISLNNKG